jgi:hypothetical protein
LTFTARKRAAFFNDVVFMMGFQPIINTTSLNFCERRRREAALAIHKEEAQVSSTKFSIEECGK